MRQIREIFKKSGVLHHAYIIEGEKEYVLGELNAFFENDLKFPIKNNPDYWCGRFNTFGIDESHTLRDMQSRMSVRTDTVGNGRKVFVVLAERITTEAQNALLKTLEDPTDGTHIFIVVPNSANLLSTVRSRAHVLRLQNPVKKERNKDAHAFLTATYNTREKIINPIIKSNTNEKDRAPALAFVENLEIEIRAEYIRSMDIKKYRNSLEAIERSRRHLNGRAPSVKMLLEYLALVV